MSGDMPSSRKRAVSVNVRVWRQQTTGADASRLLALPPLRGGCSECSESAKSVDTIVDRNSTALWPITTATAETLTLHTVRSYASTSVISDISHVTPGNLPWRKTPWS